jgi:hypothetical protein
VPAFVIIEQSGAVLCDPGALGYPDRRTDTPVRIRLDGEQTLYVDDQPHRIVSRTGRDGSVIYLIEGTSKSLRNREARAALARASTLVQQLAAELKPLAAGSEAPEPVTEALGVLSGWIAGERERAATTGRPVPEAKKEGA